MAKLTNKQIRELLVEFSPKPGYILNLSRAQFAEIVDDTTLLDIYNMPQSNADRFKFILNNCGETQIADLLVALRLLK